MKTLTINEIEALERVKEDVDITIDSKFESFPAVVRRNLKSIAPIFVALYFKVLNHDPKNKDWKNRDYVFPVDNYASIVKNIVKAHAGYINFQEIEKYLKENSFNNIENSLGEALGYYISAKDLQDRHERHYFIVLSELDLINSFSSLEYILKNNFKRIIIIAYTDADHAHVSKENKLNGRLINMGFDTLVINGDKLEYVCDAVAYAKRLDKPSVILANVN